MMTQMHRPAFGRLLHTILAVGGFGALAHGAGIKPNIVLMMADDMGMGDTSAYQNFTGNADDVQVRTPQMERLARMGVRFTDAHTASSRCSPTRYSLLTGRYPWRNRLKHWVLYGSQGDPMIEADRPTIASMLRGEGYATAMVGKWHVGLRYRRSDGSPAAGWDDADLAQPLHTTPLDHGFEYARFTSRSHGTSGPDAGKAASRKAVKPRKGKGGGNKTGPGHIHGRTVVGAAGKGKTLVKEGPNAYVLTKLGSRHSDHALGFLKNHVGGEQTRVRPFFLYYPSNSNHGPYTPDEAIGGVPVAGAARTVSGKPMDKRHDFIYENDVALGRLLDWLEKTDDPRNAGKKLIETSIVIFTSDNGAEKNSDTATGPFRSHKGSVYEGGHRVPFIVAWPGGDVGDGDATTGGLTSDAPIGLQDLYATFAEIVGAGMPDYRAGEKGAEDSFSIMPALHGKSLDGRTPLFFNDHKEARKDHAAVAIRVDSPWLEGGRLEGKWKLFFDASLLRAGKAHPYELYNLAEDQGEKNNLIGNPELKPLVEFLTNTAMLHRNAGGHRLAEFAPVGSVTFSWKTGAAGGLAEAFNGKRASGVTAKDPASGLEVTIKGVRSAGGLLSARFLCSSEGLGLTGNKSGRVNAGEALAVCFNRDVIVESAAIVAGVGACGGFYQVGKDAPLAIYCVDADIDAQDQSGILSDIGVLKAGEVLRLNSAPHFGVEAPGDWRLRSLTVRDLEK